jgi:hypothetical protein
VRVRRIAALAGIGSLLTFGTVAGLAPAASAATVPVASLLGSLVVAPENTSAYDRSYFQLWIDANSDGCDTRAEVLKSESLVPTDGGCPVLTGQWHSYYDNTDWTQASDVDIDHMVPLSEAWDSGAWAWTADQRKAYANDLDWSRSLVAVTDNVNSSKGERDPAEWMPPAASATCQYVTDWVTVKYRWSLDVDQAERNKLSSVLDTTCAGITTNVPLRADVPSSAAAVEAYITQVYQDLFHRAPDASGLATWSGLLMSGTPYGQVANGITYSDEYRSGLIQASYQQYLGRAAEPAGLAGWLGEMRAGLHIEQMQAGFISSPEFYARYGSTDRGWITGLYQTVLGRDPGSSEVDSWQVRLGAGDSRYQVSLGFLYSTEHLTTVVDGYYIDLLGRHIDPSGQATWVGQIQVGHRDEEIIASIVSSAEYRANV